MTSIIGFLLSIVLSLQSGGRIGTAIEAGGLNYADASYGPHYLAIRAHRGTKVRVCGPADCVVMVSTDVGPKNHAKVADVALVVWSQVCGVPVERAHIVGVCDGSIEYLDDGPNPTPPPTDTEG